MAQKHAYIRDVRVDGQTRRMELRGGQKGQGRFLRAVTYWPWSPPSVDAAYDYIYAAADRWEVDVVGGDRFES